MHNVQIRTNSFSPKQFETRRYLNDLILIMVITTTKPPLHNVMYFFCNHSPAEVHTPLKAGTQSSVWWSHSLVSSCSFLSVTDNSGLHSDEVITYQDIWEYCHIICRFCSLNLQAKLSCLAGPSSLYSWSVMDVDNDGGTWKEKRSVPLWICPFFSKSILILEVTLKLGHHSKNFI